MRTGGAAAPLPPPRSLGWLVGASSTSAFCADGPSQLSMAGASMWDAVLDDAALDALIPGGIG